MAGKITHIEVLIQTIKHLEHGNPEQKKIAELLTNSELKKYANLGAIAPDIFYYYHILSPSKITSRAQIFGDIHHHKNVVELILEFLDSILETEEGLDQNKLIAFVLGYICHCAVDIVTHPYIFFISGDYYSKDPQISSMAQYNHMRVEFELDSLLLDQRWGMSPNDYDFTHIIDIRRRGISGLKKMDPLIWKFWLEAIEKVFPIEFKENYLGSRKKIIPGDILNDSYLGYIKFNEILDSRNSFVRGILKTFDFVSFSKKKATTLLLPYKDTIDHKVLNLEEKEWFYPADKERKRNHSFFSLVNNATFEAKKAITMAWDYIQGKSKRDSILKEYSGYNLDTGLRNLGIGEMKEFKPNEV